MHPSTEGDVQGWVEEARRGDREALGRLFERHYDGVYRYALVRLGSVADAEDAAAETFTRMIESLHTYRRRGVPFAGWLFGIARHVVVDRGRRALRERPTDEALDRGDHGTPEEAALASVEASELRAMLDGLPETQRQVLQMRFAGGLTSAEVGAALGRSATAVRLMQMRALRALRAELEETAAWDDASHREVGPS